MKFNLKKIENKLPFFDHLTIDSSWEKEISFLDSHPEKLIDTHPKKLRYYLKILIKEAVLILGLKILLMR